MRYVVIAPLVFLCIAGFLLSCGSGRSAESGVDPNVAHKLDAPLRVALADSAPDDMLEIFVEVSGTLDDRLEARLEALGFEHAATSENILTGRATPGAIGRMAAESRVISMALSQIRSPR
jgi:hypothetical protein